MILLIRCIAAIVIYSYGVVFYGMRNPDSDPIEFFIGIVLTPLLVFFLADRLNPLAQLTKKDALDPGAIDPTLLRLRKPLRTTIAILSVGSGVLFCVLGIIYAGYFFRLAGNMFLGLLYWGMFLLQLGGLCIGAYWMMRKSIRFLHESRR